MVRLLVVDEPPGQTTLVFYAARMTQLRKSSLTPSQALPCERHARVKLHRRCAPQTEWSMSGAVLDGITLAYERAGAHRRRISAPLGESALTSDHQLLVCYLQATSRGPVPSSIGIVEGWAAS